MPDNKITVSVDMSDVIKKMGSIQKLAKTEFQRRALTGGERIKRTAMSTTPFDPQSRHPKHVRDSYIVFQSKPGAKRLVTYIKNISKRAFWVLYGSIHNPKPSDSLRLARKQHMPGIEQSMKGLIDK